MTNPTFPSDTFPEALVYPAHPTNYYLPENHGGIPNYPRGLVLHTPQEPADNHPYTPEFFADPNRQASTHYFGSYLGKLYQMVPERCAAIANGLKGKPPPVWADPDTSLNWQTINIELEGYAATIGQTMVRGEPQWNLAVHWIQVLCAKYAIPLDRGHIIGHYQVANDRTDPGTLDIDLLVHDAQGDNDMNQLQARIQVAGTLLNLSSDVIQGFKLNETWCQEILALIGDGPTSPVNTRQHAHGLLTYSAGEAMKGIILNPQATKEVRWLCRIRPAFAS